MGTRLGTDLADNLATALGADLGGGSDAITVWGVSSLSNTVHYASAAGGGEAGLASGFGRAVLFRLDALNAGFRVLSARFGSNTGYEAARVNNNVLQAGFYSSAPAFVQSQSYTYVAGDVGKWELVISQHAGSFVRLYRAAAQVGSDVAISGYSVPPGTTISYLGLRSAGLGGCPGMTIAGIVDWQGVPSPANVAAFYAAAKAEGCVVPMPGVTTTHQWCIGNDQDGISAPATLTDLVGSDDLSRVGAPTLVADSAPVWSW